MSHCASLEKSPAWPGLHRAQGSSRNLEAKPGPCPPQRREASGGSSQCYLGFALGAGGRKVDARSRGTISGCPPATAHILLSGLIKEPRGRGDPGGWRLRAGGQRLEAPVVCFATCRLPALGTRCLSGPFPATAPHSGSSPQRPPGTFTSGRALFCLRSSRPVL